MREFLLIDISNTFTKIAFADRRTLGRLHRIPTKELDRNSLRRLIKNKSPQAAVIASVVPSKNRELEAALSCPLCWVGPHIKLGIGIDYPKPSTIGADRLANASACVALYGAPAIVVDFGTAVTFDVISSAKKYIGGVIAPGLESMTEYLHSRTALLPLIQLREPPAAVGRTTRAAMLSGAVHGYRGLVSEILTRVRAEAFPRSRPHVIATGGDASVIARGTPLFDAVDPLLTLKGLQIIASLNFPHRQDLSVLERKIPLPCKTRK